MKVEIPAFANGYVNCYSAAMIPSHHAVGKIVMFRIVSCSERTEPTMKEKYQ